MRSYFKQEMWVLILIILTVALINENLDDEVS